MRRQTRVAEATPPRSSRSRRDKPQGLAPFPATGRGGLWGTRHLWRGSVDGEWGLRSGIRELADLFARVGDELSADGRYLEPPCHPGRSEAKSRDGTGRPFSTDPSGQTAGLNRKTGGSGRVVARTRHPRCRHSSPGSPLRVVREGGKHGACRPRSPPGFRRGSSGMTKSGLRFAASGMTKSHPAALTLA